MNLKLAALVLGSVGIISGCTQPAPRVDVQLPNTQVGRWTVERTVKPEYTPEQYIFLDTATGTVCALELSEIKSGGYSVSALDTATAAKNCVKLP